MSYFAAAAIGGLLGSGGRAGYLAYRHGFDVLGKTSSMQSVAKYGAYGAAYGIAHQAAGGFVGGAKMATASGGVVAGLSGLHGAATMLGPGLAIAGVKGGAIAAIGGGTFGAIDGFGKGFTLAARSPIMAVDGGVYAARMVRAAISKSQRPRPTQWRHTHRGPKSGKVSVGIHRRRSPLMAGA
jgi:hypothetical protein